MLLWRSAEEELSEVSRPRLLQTGHFQLTVLTYSVSICRRPSKSPRGDEHATMRLSSSNVSLLGTLGCMLCPDHDWLKSLMPQRRPDLLERRKGPRRPSQWPWASSCHGPSLVPLLHECILVDYRQEEERYFYTLALSGMAPWTVGHE